MDRQLREYGSATVARACKRLKHLICGSKRNGADSAAEGVREGMEDTWTVLKLDLPPVLLAFFSTTNAIENLMGEGLGTVEHSWRKWVS